MFFLPAREEGLGASFPPNLPGFWRSDLQPIAQGAARKSSVFAEIGPCSQAFFPPAGVGKIPPVGEDRRGVAKPGLDSISFEGAPEIQANFSQKTNIRNIIGR